MNKIFSSVLLTFLLCSLFSINAQAKLSEEFIVNTITEDFLKTHNIKVNGYKYMPIRKFSPDKENLTSEQKSLQNIVQNIAEDQIGGDWSPIIYINKETKKGYALEKKLSGTNKLHFLSYEEVSQKWNVTESIDKKGSDLTDLGLLKN